MDVMNLNDLNGYTVKSCYFALDVYTKYRFDGPIFQGKGGGGDLSKYFFCIELLFLYQCTSIVVLIVKNAKSHGFALQKNLHTKKIYKSHAIPIIRIYKSYVTENDYLIEQDSPTYPMLPTRYYPFQPDCLVNLII